MADAPPNDVLAALEPVVDRWADELGVADLLATARRQASGPR